MTADDTPAQPGAWLPIPEAAKRLGIHVRTVHRWLDDGRLTLRKLGSNRTEVWVPDHLTADDTSESTPETPQGTSELGLAVLGQHMALIERQGEIAALQVAQQMAPLIQELAATRQQMAEQTEKMIAQGEEIGRLKAENRAVTLQKLELEKIAAARPWWRRWFGP